MDLRRLLSLVLIFRVITLLLWVFVVAYVAFIASWLGGQRFGDPFFVALYAFSVLLIAYYVFTIALISWAKKGSEGSLQILCGTLIFSGVFLLILTVLSFYVAIAFSMITHPLAVFLLLFSSALPVLCFLFAIKLNEAHKEALQETDQSC